MDVSDLLKELRSDFYAGVPDSQLRALCDYLVDNFGVSGRHIIAANEGNGAALAAGYHLATGRVPVVYMQNSGIGNIVNPVVSLMDDRVYGIPCIFIIGWRGEPGTHDEPQHIFQGEITQKLLEDIGVHAVVIGAGSSSMELKGNLMEAHRILGQGGRVAFLVGAGALPCQRRAAYQNPYVMARESVIEYIVEVAGQDIIVSTTGKASRELFEVRERMGQGHQSDFLTVGSMGHSSSIALGIALGRPDKKVWCIDGDGAALMHMGAMAVIGGSHPENMVHIVINNEAHETVGGMPTAARSLDLKKIAEGCGYPYVADAEGYGELKEQLLAAKNRNALSFLEAKCAIGSRGDLGRPTLSPQENKRIFMGHLRGDGHIR